MSVPQFGHREDGRDYPDRPAAFVLLEQDGRIACVRVAWRRGGPKLDLPGGGLDPDESPAAAAARECGEEAGLRVTVAGEPFVRADHYFVNDEGRSNNTRGSFFTARLEAEAPELKVEDDHDLVWLEPLEAIRALDRESHAWAVAAWLRRTAPWSLAASGG
ncbi:NUDIX domain-containing protein [Phenylobacterium sp. LjRoot219]|uniref:NUDIX domain-containing protein n=1 Tax=Phenylobacterium sp. LjRoot219 TaxID=3342283 RepID=UPI003ECF860D